ncbi:MAG: DUF11 domain-containing protein [Cyanobacteria bacterium J06633_23]
MQAQEYLKENLEKSLKSLTTIAGVGCLLMFSALPARAEGSQDLVDINGYRPFLEYRNNFNGDVQRRTIIKVYAAAGETIDLGSSAVGIGGGIIEYTAPNNTSGDCGTDGLIANRAEEIAGPGDGTGNTFIPCTVTVTAATEGIWEIDFVSPSPGAGGNPTPAPSTNTWTQTNSGYVFAWDATVRSSVGTPIEGRVYANYYAFNMGGNGGAIQLSSEFTVLTKEGYQYRIDLNSIDPFGFIFFANRNGFFDISTGDSIFRSLQLAGSNPGALPPGYDLHNPNEQDVGIYITHKTFINPPDSSMPSSASIRGQTTWLYSLPEPPPVPANFSFTGIEGTAGTAGTAPLGGTLTFDSASQNAFSITIDLSEDNIYGNLNDRTFVGRSVVGANSIFWDGLDGNGDKVSPSTIPYTVQINQYAGEAHFPIIDAEQNNSGIIIERLNQPAGSTADPPFTIYYDDRNLGGDFSLCASGESTTNTGVANPVCYGGPPAVRQALAGTDSNGGGHEFTSNFGDRRGIDTWVYYPSTDVQLSGGIVIREADLIVDKVVNTPTEKSPGDSVTYTVTVTNDGPNNEAGITFVDNVPAAITGVSWSCSITSGNGTCNETSGSGNNISTTLDLDDQAVATYTISGTLSTSASGTITNEAQAIRNLDITDPDESNNIDDAVITIAPTPVPVGKFCYLVRNSDNRLVQVDINTGAENDSIGPVGASGDVRAIEYRSRDGLLFVANDTVLGQFNTNTNTYTTIGSGFGSTGAASPISVDGLAFHPYTGELFGSTRNTGSDLLIKINPTTGAFIPGAFGGADSLTISTSGSTTIGDIAFDPVTGGLFGIANFGGTNFDRLVSIDTTTGSTTVVGSNLGINRMESLSAFNNGNFYGTTGDESEPSSLRNHFYSVNASTGVASFISSLTTGGAYESIACATDPENQITGTVFLDPDTDGVLNTGAGDSGTANASVRLYRDTNGNGSVDAADILLASQNTATTPNAGTFDYSFPAVGAFVLDVDSASLPPDNSVFTTDNLEAADFGSSVGIVDANNDFGHFTDSSLAIVKRITAVNNLRITSVVDNPSDDNDNHPHWPGTGFSTFLAGATEYSVEPGDDVEYTIYYLATGNFPVTNVLLCDRIPTGATYIPESMVLFTSSVTSNLTDTNTDGDGGEYLSVGDPTVLPCTESDTGGTVVVNLAPSPTQLPNATGPGTPTNAYGFIRFRVTVD